MSNQDHLRRQAEQAALQRQKPQNTHGMTYQSANTYNAAFQRTQNANNNRNNNNGTKK